MLLAHDLGTTGDKASLHQDDGALVAAVVEEYPTDFAPGGRVEQDPADWWASVCVSTRALLAATNTRPEEVHAVSFSGQMMGATLLDGDKRPTRPTLIWADTRSDREAQHVVERVGMADGYRILGHRLNATYTLSKLMWVRDHQPEVFKRTRHVCAAKDYIGWKLTGHLATDPSDASAMNAFDQHSRHWSDTVLDAAGLDAALFPPILASTDILGEVTAEAAAECGLRPGTFVVVGGGDGPMAAVGAGVTRPEDGAYACLGTSSWISLTATEPLYDPSMATMTFDHVRPGHFVPTATMQAGAGSLEWWGDVVAPNRSSDRFERILSDCVDWPVSAEGLYFLPYLLGERSPYWDPAARGTFLGLARHHGQGHLTRAILEGVGFNLLTCLNAFRACGVEIDAVDAVGGGARSDTWLQILADIWGCAVHRRTIVGEGNSLGAAVTAGTAIGTIPDLAAARRLSTVSAEFLPDAERHAGYHALHERFSAAYEALRPWFAASLRTSDPVAPHE